MEHFQESARRGDMAQMTSRVEEVLAYRDIAMTTLRYPLFPVTCIILAASIAACAPVKIKTGIYALDGSRSGGTLDVAYEPGTDGVTATDWQQGLSLAAQKCGAWGYQAADPFGGRITLLSKTIVKYQCLGSPDNKSLTATQTGAESNSNLIDKSGQLRSLSDQNIPYEEYQRRYQAIIAQ